LTAAICNASPVLVAFGMLAIILGGGALLQKPEYLVLSLIVLWPVRDFHIISVITTHRVLIWLLFGYYVLRHWLTPSRPSSRAARVFHAMTGLFVVIIMFSLIRAIAEQNVVLYITPTSLKRTVFSDALITIENIMLFYVVYWALETAQQIQRVLDLLMLVAVVIAGLGIVQYFAGGNPGFAGVLFYPELIFYGRATSIFSSPNELSHFLAFILGMAFASVIWGGTNRWYFLLSVIAIDLAALMLSFSRSGILTVVGGIVLMSCFYYAKITKWRLTWKIFLFLAVLIMTIVLSVQYYDLFLRFRLAQFSEFDYREALLKIRTGSDYKRMYAMKQALTTFFQHPILGIGYDVFVGKNVALGLMPHSQYLRILAEMGLLGFIPFLVMIAAVFQTGLKAWHNQWRADYSPETRRLMFRLLIGIGTLMLTACTVDFLHIRSLGGGLWLLCAAVFVLDRHCTLSKHE